MEEQRAGRSNDGEEQAPELSEKSVNSAQNWEGSFRAHSGQGSVLLCPRPENLNEAGLKGDELICLVKEIPRECNIWTVT